MGILFLETYTARNKNPFSKKTIATVRSKFLAIVKSWLFIFPVVFT